MIGERTLGVFKRNTELDLKIEFKPYPEKQKLFIGCYCEDIGVEFYFSYLELEGVGWNLLDFKIENELLGIISRWLKENPPEKKD